MRPPLDNSVVLITGASAGIGRELARQFAPRARALALVARRAERLEEVRAELLARHPELIVHVLPCDLGDPAAVEALLSAVAQTVGAVDILVNNAGLGDQALYDQADWARIRQMLEVNVVALARLTHHFVGPMVARGRGGVLNIGSGAGFALLPGAAAYTGTKHFVTGFSATLQAELAAAGVAVTQVCPGPVDTEFDEVAGMRGLAGGPPHVMRISAEQCARAAVQGFARGQPLVFPGAAYKALMVLLPLIPRPLLRAMARRVARRLRTPTPQAVERTATP